MIFRLFLSYLLILTLIYFSGLLLSLINRIASNQDTVNDELFRVSLGPSSLLTGWVFLVGVIAAILTEGKTIFMLTNLGILFYVWYSPPFKTERHGSTSKIIFNTFFLAAISFVAFWLLSSRFADIQSISYYEDKYFYSQVGISLVKNGIESTNLGSAFAGFQGNYLPYHYLELWSSGLSGLGLNLPVLLMLQYVFPALAIFISISFLQTTLCETKSYNHYGLWIIISLICLAVFPKLPIHSDYFGENSFLHSVTKLLFLIVFFSGMIYAVISQKQEKLYLFLFLTGVTFFTALPAILLTMGVLIIHSFLSKGNKNYTYLQSFKKLMLPIILFVLACFYIFYLSYDINRGAEHIYSGIDKSHSVLTSISEGFFASIFYHLRPALSRYIISVIFTIIIAFKYRKQKMGIITFGIILGSFIATSAFYQVIDGDQFVTNTVYSLLLAFTMFCPVILKKKFQLLTSVLLVIYTCFYFITIPQNLVKESMTIDCINPSDNLFIGTYSNPSIFNNKYLTNSSIQSVGNFILNYENKILVSLNEFDLIEPQDELSEIKKKRLELNFLSQYLRHSEENREKSSFISKKLDIIISDNRNSQISFKGFTSDCTGEYVDVWVKQGL